MPQFAPGEVKRAIAPITVRPSGLSCEAEIFLGPDPATKEATSGRVGFTSTGARQSVRLPITMPAVEGTYHSYIDVYAEGLLIAAYKAIEDVVIATLVPVTIDSFRIRCDFPKNIFYTKVTITNHTSQTFIDETPTGAGGGLVTQLWAIGYPPIGIAVVFQPREWDGFGIGNVPPGTHTYQGVIQGSFFEAYGVSEGAFAHADVFFRSINEIPTPVEVFYSTHQMFEGIFSSVWREWVRSTWVAPERPPPPGR